MFLLGCGFVVWKAGDQERNDVFRTLRLREPANLVIDVETLSSRRGTENNQLGGAMNILFKRLNMVGACKVFVVTEDVEVPLWDLEILRWSI